MYGQDGHFLAIFLLELNDGVERVIVRVEQSLAAYRPKRSLLRPLARRSAVALILQQREGQLHVLMIQRADREGDPWSGQMAFPGGHLEAVDRHGRDAAVRETEEEIGLTLDQASPCIGRLSDIMARPRLVKPMIVSPYVFRIDKAPRLVLNYEVADTVWIPIPYFQNSANREEMQWTHGKVSMTLPCYLYRDYRVWGLSLMMLDELLKVMPAVESLR
ncbi:MAG: 8-oxo-dGTP pyrophosphatase MutT (NUDIX family) [Halieaceae bacterium]